MSRTLIRFSTEADVPEIAAIYGHHVLHGSASFEVVPPLPEEIARRRLAVLERGLPFLVAETGGIVVAYAYASPYRSRVAYRFSVEDSIYVHPAHARRGLGRSLLPELVKACEGGEWRQMIAVIGDSENVASIRLHQAFGFRHVGTLRSVGFKFGRWLDTVLMQRQLGSGDGTLPAEPNPSRVYTPPMANERQSR
jgi:phosphinothricin acetyltransferase